MLSSAQVDRSILFGSLAIGTGIVSAEYVLHALKKWSPLSPHDLSEQLVQEGRLSESDRDYVNLLVDVEWENFNGEMSQAIKSFDLSEEVRVAFSNLRLQDNSRSITSLGGAPPVSAAQYWTGGHSLSTKSNYVIVDQYKGGGLGMVYLARDTTFGREVAIKEIQPEHHSHEILRTRFRDEAEITSQLDHPNIVPVHGIGTSNDRPFFVMKLIRGVSLKEAVDLFHRNRKQDPRPSRDTMELRRLVHRFISVCEAIGFAHSKHVMHRDIKPGNIMLGEYGESIVVDWGLAKRFTVEPAEGEVSDNVPAWSQPDRVTLTRVGAKEGTPGYMAPEVALGQRELLSPRTDIFCLGATLYYILTGQAPYEGKSGVPALEEAVKTECPAPRSIYAGVPRSLEAVCRKAMSTNPADRYATCKELAAELESWLADEPVRVHRENWPDRLARSIRKHRAVYTVTALSIFFIMILLTVMSGAIGQARINEVKANEEADLARVVSVLNADVKTIPELMDSFKSSRPNIEGRLFAILKDTKLEKDQKLRIYIALLESRPALVHRLCDEILDSDYKLVNEVRKIFVPYKSSIIDRLWQDSQNATTKGQRLNACILLSELDPEDLRWKTVGEETARAIITPEVKSSVEMSSVFRNVRRSMFETIRKSFLTSSSTDAKKFAATAANELANDLPDVLCDFLLESDPDQFRILYSGSLKHLVTLEPRLLALLTKSSSETVYDLQQSELDRLARQKANAMKLLLRGGMDAHVWQMLRFTKDNRVRTQFIDEIKKSGVEPEHFVRRLAVELDPGIRRGLLYCLAEYDLMDLTNVDRTELLERLQLMFEKDPDRGTHSLCGWLLRKWGQDLEKISIAATQFGAEPFLDRDWLVSPKGLNLVVFRGKTSVQIGSRPEEEHYRSQMESIHQVVIDRTYCISTKEISVEQYLEFDPKFPPSSLKKNGDPLKNPVTTISWHDAARYCNWLSLQEGIPHSELCYEVVTDTRVQVTDAKLPPRLVARNKPNFLKLRGYRLPTEAEWHNAHRAGTVTNYFFGHLSTSTTKYGWISSNAKASTFPVGLLLPNENGMFDVIGNVSEWTDDRQVPSEREYMTTVQDDDAKFLPILHSGFRIFAGSAFLNGTPSARTGYRNFTGPDAKYDFLGFRVARTIAAKPE